MDFKPKAGYLLIKKYEEEQKHGSLIMPDSYTAKDNEGVVMAYGGTISEKFGIEGADPYSVGDHVLYKFGAGMQLVMDNETYLVMSEDDILGTFVD